MAGLKHPVTPDGRYFVVRGKLWRMSNPNIDPMWRAVLVLTVLAAMGGNRPRGGKTEVKFLTMDPTVER
jgi:hypothetical protein